MSSQRAFLAIAHRGASAYEPENSLRAFRRAIALGADMSELDVHMSKDGQIVVIHNDSVQIDGQRKAVADLTLEELRQVDIGLGERIPTLQEVISAVKGKSGLYIELKGATTPQPVADVLRANGFTDCKQVIVGSFLLPLVQRDQELRAGARHVDPRLARSLRRRIDRSGAIGRRRLRPPLLGRACTGAAHTYSAPRCLISCTRPGWASCSGTRNDYRSWQFCAHCPSKASAATRRTCSSISRAQRRPGMLPGAHSAHNP